METLLQNIINLIVFMMNKIILGLFDLLSIITKCIEKRQLCEL